MEAKKTAETRQLRDLQARRQCQSARELESSGDYEGARAALSGLWIRIGERPVIEKLQSDTQAEVLLRVGALAGWLGSAQQIGGAQEFAKDLLGESIRLFESLSATQKKSEAQTDLAICYWREGALDEARVLLREALSAATSPEGQLRVLVNSSVVEISDQNPDQAMTLLSAAASLEELVPDSSLRGRYHQQLGLTYKRLSGAENLDRALIEWSAASLYFKQAKHIRYQARIENNLGFLLLQLDRHFEALLHLDKARNIFVALKDTGSVAQVNETRARVFIAQERYSEAESAAFAAVSTLEQGGEQPLLAEALLTQGIALARRGRHQGACSIFRRSANIASTAGDPQSAAVAYLTMIEELQQLVASSELLKFYREADDLLGTSPSKNNLTRLRLCGRIVTESLGKSDNVESSSIGGSFEQEILHFEAQLIKRALDQANGSITRAARSLGITHQGLAFIIDNRHNKALGRARNPKRIRRRSLTTKQ